MPNLVNIILKQHDVGIWWGALKNTISESSFIITVFNMIMLIPTFYVTALAPWALQNGIEIPFWIVIVSVIVAGVLVLLVQYKVFTPSSFAFWAKQFWEHGDNPIIKKMEEQDNRLDKMEKMIEELVNRK